LVGVAVNVTGVPPALEHIDVEFEVMITEGVIVGFTTIDVEATVLAQPATVAVTL
jgi:hypothetical protein